MFAGSTVLPGPFLAKMGHFEAGHFKTGAKWLSDFTRPDLPS